MSYTKEQIKQARQTNLAEYLMSVGTPLKRNGHRHNHADHDSLVFTKNAYYWNSRQEKGNAIDYLTKHMGYSFQDAVIALTGFSPTEKENCGSAKKEFIGVELNADCRKAIAYLHKTRGINYSVIQWLINQRLLMQQTKTNNIIFPMHDENGECVGAELQGTLSDRRFKGVAEGSKYGYGFNTRYPSPNGYKYALFFESAVDLVSFIDIKRNHEKKPLTACILVSMAGLKINIIERVLRVFKGNLRPVLCVDRDNAGYEFINTVKGLKIDFKTCMPNRKKDWNEELLGMSIKEKAEQQKKKEATEEIEL